MKILITYILISTSIFASSHSCLTYMNEMNKAQDELVIYIAEGMNADANIAAKHAKAMAIKSKVNCSDVKAASSFDFNSKIQEFSAIQKKYKR